MASLRSKNTERAYRADINDWTRWCADNDATPFPGSPEHVAQWIDESAGLRSHATIRRRRSAISAEHRDRGLPNPADASEVAEAVDRSRRAGPRGTGKPDPMRSKIVRAALAAWNSAEDLLAQRDAAALALGYSAAAKPSEATAVTVGDVIPVGSGLVLRVPDRRFPKGECFVGVAGGLSSDALLRWRLALEGADDDEPFLRRIGRERTLGGDALSAHSLVDVCRRAAVSAGLEDQRWAQGAAREGFLVDAEDVGLPRWLVEQHARLKVGPRPDPETLVLHAPSRLLGV